MKPWKFLFILPLVAMVVFACAPVANAGLCDLFHHSAHSAHSAGSTGGTYVAVREVRHVHTVSYGSSGGVPTQVLAAPRLHSLFTPLRRQHTVLIEPTAVSANCDGDCPNCNRKPSEAGEKGKPPVDVKKE